MASIHICLLLHDLSLVEPKEDKPGAGFRLVAFPSLEFERIRKAFRDKFPTAQRDGKMCVGLSV
jgi:hypothetical protein